MSLVRLTVTDGLGLGLLLVYLYTYTIETDSYRPTDLTRMMCMQHAPRVPFPYAPTPEVWALLQRETKRMRSGQVRSLSDCWRRFLSGLVDCPGVW